MSRTIVVGDIHGCYDELIALLDQLDLQREDRVIGVGDLTVKGPKNREVVELFSTDKRFQSVIGNHDLALVKKWKDPSRPIKKTQQNAYAELTQNGDSLLRYLSSLPYFIKLPEHIIVHAGVRPSIPLSQQDPKDFTELRTLGEDRTNRDGVPWYSEYQGPKKVIFGHWPSAEPRTGPFALGIDSGCVYGFELTAYILETEEFFRVKAAREYQKPDDRSAKQ